MTKDISFLYSKTVTTKDNELIQNYINSLSEVERDNFNSIVKDIINTNIKITHNAVRLSLKLYKDTNIKVFPCVFKSACKSYSVGDGSYSFFMYVLDKEKHRHIINSYHKVKTLLLKGSKLIIKIAGFEMSYDDMIIDIK